MPPAPDWTRLDGADRRHVAEQVWQLWHAKNHDAALVVGFPGLGKTEHLADALITAAHVAGVPTALVETPPLDTADVDAVLTEALIDALRFSGHGLLADDVAREPNFPTALKLALARGALVIVDDLQHQFAPGTHRAPDWLDRVLAQKSHLRPLAGRLVILANRAPEAADWDERVRRFTLDPPDDSAAAAILDAATPSPDRRLTDRRDEVINRLGANPRALTLLAHLLDRFTVAELLGPPPDTAAPRSRDPELVDQIERRIISKATDDLAPPVRNWLSALAVLRRPAQVELIEAMAPADFDWRTARKTLRARYLLRLDGNRDRLHALVRELEMPRLRANPAAWTDAHRRAAEWYARPLRGKRPELVAWRLDEARYHYTAAGDADALAAPLAALGDAARRPYGFTTPLPASDDERDARIALLSAMLTAPGPGGAEYHLARLLRARGAPDDLRRAAEHARRSTVGVDFQEPWTLWVELTHLTAGLEPALTAARAGMEAVDPGKNLFALYQLAGELLAGAERVHEAVAVLREGMGRVPPEKGLYSLYQLAGELLARAGRVDEALATFEQGLGRIPIGQGSRERIAEAAVLNAAAAGDDAALGRLLAAPGERALDAGPAALAESLRQMLAGDWSAAVTAAAAGRAHLPTYLPLAALEAVAALGAETPAAAAAALARFPNKIRDEVHAPTVWLAALIACLAGDPETARAHYATYTGQPVDATAAPDRATLIADWAAPFARGVLHPAFYFPLLPPAATGQPGTLRRPPSGPPVLITTGSAAPLAPVAAPVAAPVVAVTAPGSHPTLPPPLVKAHKAGRLVPFVGAGLSLGPDVFGGFPTWRALPGRLLDACDEYWVWGDNHDRATLRARFLVPDRAAPGGERPRPMALGEMLRQLDQLKAKLGHDYPAALTAIFRPPDARPGAAHAAVMALEAPAVLTSNYDPLLELAAGPARQRYTGRQAKAALADLQAGRPVLFKVHGSADDAASVVLTLDEYREAHADASYQAVMKHLLTDRSFLFIGYGMSDPADLDLLLAENVAALGGASPLHFALLPCLASEQAEAERRDRLRTEHRVAVIAYDPRDDHREAVDFLRALAAA